MYCLWIRFITNNYYIYIVHVYDTSMIDHLKCQGKVTTVIEIMKVITNLALQFKKSS